MPDADEVSLLRRRLEREIARRESAEKLAETRTRDLFMVNEELRAQLVAVLQFQERLERDALTDPLTGAVNRRGLFRWLEEQLQVGNTIAVAYVDLVGFKLVNDTFSHAAGDFVLNVMVQRFRESAGDEAMVSRMGGDEFVIAIRRELLPNGNVEALSDQLLATAEAPIAWENRMVRAGVRCGTALSEPGDTPDSLLVRADHELSVRQRGQE